MVLKIGVFSKLKSGRFIRKNRGTFVLKSMKLQDFLRGVPTGNRPKTQSVGRWAPPVRVRAALLVGSRNIII